ncbi:hypothetical protein ORD22_08140 [Sporosarcina sp. GW1-11]|uniref:hypothetical protein n=1 Tax=Sporosarcina sp. GW1-11 TaxID=2899126 RepID=UPI00294E8894|nr:hypothetical protein [Sporosarcina sp. GW1-11]MDV6378216.1 hypothetical protein [Sporosarcina sp. GW1-11]
MNISMSSALVGDTIMTLQQLDERPDLKDSLQCVGCGNRISYVKSHRLRDGTLKRSCLRATWQHSDDCEFNILGNLRQLVEDTGDGFTENDVGEFLLQIDLNQPMEHKVNVTIAQPKKARLIFSNPQQDKQLDRYITTIKRIIEINNKIEKGDVGDGDDDTFRRKIRVQIADRIVRWDQFHYREGLDELKKCFRYGKQHKDSIVCIEGNFHLREDKEFYRLELEKPLVRDRNAKGIREIPSVSFLIRNEVMIEKLLKNFKGEYQKRGAVLATIRCAKFHLKGKDYCFLDMRGEIFSRNQVLFM